ncbi:mitogen activated protein kinase [Rhodocollybia butyracea]|uniref:Mitogen-activated protein kinase n=1 Tax=Rhodocollybia butyracea TaxID=206335 RepID=A0A9P5Q416_9AGAR|nr:mitogen activated protein kinase [Rhodocollybia butyracea]
MQQAAPTKKKSSKPLPSFAVGEDYELLYLLGEGAYGQVVAALHKPTRRRVAIKKVLPFEHTLFCLRTLREVKLLKYFSESSVNGNIVSILDMVKPESLDSFQELYLIQELMQTDLHKVIRTQQLSDDHAQYFIYQTLRGLKTIHSADIVHRDLKPANLLVNANCDLKICDFGLARLQPSSPTTDTGGRNLTEYVATRWYRPPELSLSMNTYTKAVDMWAVGCILGELICGRPLFPGRDYRHQLELILHVIGTPTLEEFHAITPRRSREYLRSMPIRKRQDFNALFPLASAEAIDFLQRTLTFDPDNRMTAEEGLEHPYVAAYHDAEDEPLALPMDADLFSFDDIKEQLSRKQLKELLYEEIVSFESSLATKNK